MPFERATHSASAAQRAQQAGAALHNPSSIWRRIPLLMPSMTLVNGMRRIGVASPTTLPAKPSQHLCHAPRAHARAAMPPQPASLSWLPTMSHCSSQCSACCPCCRVFRLVYLGRPLLFIESRVRLYLWAPGLRRCRLGSSQLVTRCAMRMTIHADQNASRGELESFMREAWVLRHGGQPGSCRQHGRRSAARCMSGSLGRRRQWVTPPLAPAVCTTPGLLLRSESAAESCSTPSARPGRSLQRSKARLDQTPPAGGTGERGQRPAAAQGCLPPSPPPPPIASERQLECSMLAAACGHPWVRQATLLALPATAPP